MQLCCPGYLSCTLPAPAASPGGFPSPWAAAPHAFLTLCQGVPCRSRERARAHQRQTSTPAKGTDQMRSPELPDGGLGCRAEVGGRHDSSCPGPTRSRSSLASEGPVWLAKALGFLPLG